MSFVEIDGWAVPVQDGSASEEYVEIGAKARAFSGQLRSTRRSIKRQWKFTSIQMTRANAEALRGAIMGEGERFAYDSDLYGSKGTAPDSGAVYTIRKAADGAYSSDAKFGLGSLGTDRTTGNLSSVKSTNGTHAGWTAVDTTVTTNTSNYYVATGSIKCVMSSTVNSTRASVGRIIYTSLTGPQASSLSCYVKAVSQSDTGKKLRITYETQSFGGAVDTITKTVTLRGPDEWVRVENASFTATNPAATDSYIRIEEDTIDEGPSFYLDAIQLEDLAFSTSFTATSRASTSTIIYSTYSPFRTNTNGLTLSIWTTGTNPNATYSQEMYLLRWAGSGSGVITLGIRTNDDIRFMCTGNGGESNTLDYTPPWNEDWHMVTAVLTHTPAADDKYKMEIYFDGVQAAVDTDVEKYYVPTLSALATLTPCLAANAGTDKMNQPVDDLVILPYAASAEQIAAWYYKAQSNASSIHASNFGAIPAINASGDFTPAEETITVHGDVNSLSYHQAYRPRTLTPTSTEVETTDYAFESNDQVLDFTLEEV